MLIFREIAILENRKIDTKVQIINSSKQGRPPQESERGPYAVVDERCEDTTLDSTMKDLLQHHFYLIFGP